MHASFMAGCGPEVTFLVTKLIVPARVYAVCSMQYGGVCLWRNKSTLGVGIAGMRRSHVNTKPTFLQMARP